MNSNNDLAIQFQELVRQVDIRIRAVHASNEFKQELRELLKSKWKAENYTVGGDIQYWESYIAGYISRVLSGRPMKEPRAVREDLKANSIFGRKHILEWYKDSAEYKTVAHYVELMELARAYIVDYCDAILESG